jgi:hypothetical protein
MTTPENPQIESQQIVLEDARLSMYERVTANAKRVAGVAGLAVGAYMVGDSAKTLLYDAAVGNIPPDEGLDVALAIPKYAAGWVICATGFGAIVNNRPSQLLASKKRKVHINSSNE